MSSPSLPLTPTAATTPRTITRVRQPALSRREQSAFADLVQRVADARNDVTVICGAGISVDSGLPTWKGLIEKLATDIPDPELQALVLLAPVDLPRKAEYILALGSS